MLRTTNKTVRSPLTRQALKSRRAKLLLAGASPFVLSVAAPSIMTPEAAAQAVNLNPSVNKIRIDGRTKTKIRVQGKRTSIRTDTVSNGTGFNSFSDFQQAAGERVDLYVPDSAGALVNIVRNGKVVVNGSLNAYKDGKIGGNIFFSSSKGFVVGKTGRINVGSLTVNTPTQDFIDKVISADGRVNDLMASRLMRGEIPISQHGHIAIHGRVDAQDGIKLQGRSITLSGNTAMADGAQISQRMKFDATVNGSGLQEGAALVSRGGRIAIVAADDARISGTVDVSGTTTRKAGSVDIRSGRDIVVDADAVLRADAHGTNSAGGTMIVKADDRLLAADGSRYSAKGAGTGDGGFVELSGRHALIGSVEVDLSSKGKAGTFLIDPIDLLIGGTSNGGTSVTPNMLTNGANFTLEAENSITVQAGGILDSTKAGGPAGNITLLAPIITLGDGSQILAGTTGDVLLQARDTATGLALTGASLPDFTAETAITLGTGTGTAAVVQGRNVTLSAVSTSDPVSVAFNKPVAKATIALGNTTVTAAGTFTANAKAQSKGSTAIKLPVGVFLATSKATVEIGTGASLTAGSVALNSTSDVVSNNATAKLNPASATADAAVAVTKVDSTARVSVGGNAAIISTGNVALTSTNTITSTLDATPEKAAFGAAVGYSDLTSVTETQIVDQATITAGSLTLSGTSQNTVAIKAAAAKGGAREPEAGSKAKEILGIDRFAQQAQSDGVGVSVVGALAVSDFDADTRTRIAGTGAIKVTSKTALSATTGNSSTIIADGSAVEGGSVGVGAALGLNMVEIDNEAVLDRDISTGELSLKAAQGAGGNVVSTAVTSGAGADTVGVAGAFAVNTVDTETKAIINEGKTATLTAAGSGDVALSATGGSTVTGSALPTGAGATGGTVGIGASLAINVVANRTRAALEKNAKLSGARDVALTATARNAATATAKAGSAGGVSVTPVLGLSIIGNSTAAMLEEGATLSARAVNLSARQTSDTKTSADASAAGSKAAVGLGLAIALVDDEATARTNRSVTATGAVSITAAGRSTSESVAKASAVGAEGDDSSSGGSGPSENVDEKVNKQLASGSKRQKDAGVGSTKQQAKTTTEAADKDSRSASSPGGVVSVAAGVSLNVQDAVVEASTADGVSIDATNGLSLGTDGNASGSASADGSAVGEKDDKGNEPPKSKIGIGAAVAINLASSRNDAVLGKAAHSVGGLSITAGKRDVAALIDGKAATAQTDAYGASATAGAGGDKVGIAGALALNLIDNQSQAKITDGASVDLKAGTLNLASEAAAVATTKASPAGDGATGGQLGVGASAAINIIANRSNATVEDNVTLTNADATTLDAKGNFTTTTQAEAGSAGALSVTPVLALSLIANETRATLGKGNTLTSSGAVSLKAAQTASTTTDAKSAAEGAKAAIGASFALALIEDEASAETQRSITAGGALSLGSANTSSSSITAEASAAGAEGEDDETKGAKDGGVDDQANKQIDSGRTRRNESGVGSTRQRGKMDASAAKKDDRSAKTSEGKIAAAAAVGIAVLDASSKASHATGTVLQAGGRLSLESDAVTSSSVTSDGSAVTADGGTAAQVGVGVAVSVNVAKETNTAVLTGTGHSANGVTLRAGQKDADGKAARDTFAAKATSGAGGSKVGVAGSLALNVITTDDRARLAENAAIAAGTGTSEISATQHMDATAEALPSGGGATGGKVGVGASVALNVINTDVLAEVGKDSALTGGAGLTVEAETDGNTVTKAAAGAAGGIAVDVSLALATLDQRTTARIASSNTALAMSTGAVKVKATSSGTHDAESDGNNKSGKVGVGASAALIIGTGEDGTIIANTSKTLADVQRDITAGSLVIEAGADRSYKADATATSGGGLFSDSDEKKNDKTGGEVKSTKTIDRTKSSQNNIQKGTKASSKDGKTGSSAKVSVAAAAGIAAVQDVTQAQLGAVTVTTAGDVSITAKAVSGVETVGDGRAVSGTSATGAKVGVGIGVGLGILNNTTRADIADGATIAQSGFVTVSATSSENAAKQHVQKLTARANAGASASKIAVAGALAVGISTGETVANIGANAKLTSTGAVTVTADNATQLSAKASSLVDATAGKVGVGAAIALSVAERTTLAEVKAGHAIKSNGLTVEATGSKVTRDPSIPGAAALPTDYKALKDPKDVIDKITEDIKAKRLFGVGNSYAEAIGGAAAGKIAVQGSFAVNIFEDSVTARLGRNAAANAIDAGTGHVNVTASSKSAAKSLAGGVSLSGKVGVGVSANVVVALTKTVAEIAEGTQIDKADDITVKAESEQDVDMIAVSAAAGSNIGVGGVASVLTSITDTDATVGKGAKLKATGDVTLDASSTLDTFNLAGAAAGGGKVGVGASGTVIVVDNSTDAKLADATNASEAVTVDTPGNVTVKAAGKVDGKTLTAAGAAAGKVAVGAGLAVYKIGTSTNALVGKHADIGSTTRAADVNVTAEDDVDLNSIAAAAGGAGSVGVGAAGSVAVLSRTTAARISDDAAVKAADVLVKAQASDVVRTVVAGAGIGGKVGVAGSVEVSSVSNTTKAELGARADVNATNNAGILADGETRLHKITGAIAAGGKAGVGAAATISVVNTDVRATVEDGASVTAGGAGSALAYTKDYQARLGVTIPAFTLKGQTVDLQKELKLGDRDITSNLTGGDARNSLTAADAQAAGLNMLAGLRGFDREAATAKGVVVNAAGSTSIQNLTAAGGLAGAAGVGFGASVPVVTTSVKAAVKDNAKLAGGDVTVAAASDAVSFATAGALGGGGKAGVGVGAGVSVLNTTTQATVADATTTGSNLTLSALSHADIATTGIAGGAAGVAGVGGSASVAVVTTDTKASLDGAATLTGNVDVIADDQTRVAQTAGAIGVGVKVGVGATAAVVHLKKGVLAEIAGGATVTSGGMGPLRTVRDDTDYSATKNARGVNIQAESAQSIFGLTMAGAAGGYAGVGGAVAVNITDIATTATIGDNAKVTTNGAQTSDVVVAARDTTATSTLTGGFGAGIAGVGGAVEIGVFRNAVSARLGNGASVDATGDVAVSGLSNKATQSIVASAAGGAVGVAAGVSVLAYGDGAAKGGTADKKIGESSTSGSLSLQNITASVDTQVQDGSQDDVFNGSGSAGVDEDIAATSRKAQATRSAISVSSAVGAATPKGTSATSAGATVKAGGAVSLTSDDTMKVDQFTGAVSAGGAAISAGIGVITAKNGAASAVDRGTITAGSASVEADTDHDLDSIAIAATLGGSAALNADVAVIDDEATTQATVDAANVVTTGAVKIDAQAKRKAKVLGVGAGGAGGAAIGASIALGTSSGKVIAQAGRATGSAGRTTITAGSLDVTAGATDNVDAQSIAAGGGLGLAIQGSIATAKTDAATTASANAADITTSGKTTIAATSRTETGAGAKAASVAITGAVGGSFAKADATGATRAGVAGSTVKAGSLDVTSDAATAGKNVNASAIAASGALVGITGTKANAENDSTSSATTTGTSFDVAGRIAVSAKNTTKQKADAKGKTIAYYAAGANDAVATSDTKTTADFGHTGTLKAGSLSVTATGSDLNDATTVAGSGGVVAGTAGVARTEADADTRATVSGGTGNGSVAGLADIDATQTVEFKGEVDALAAGVAGASGALIDHDVDSVVAATIADDAKLVAGDLTVDARNNVKNDKASGWNVNAIAGGLLGLPASSADVDVDLDTKATLGKGADVRLTKTDDKQGSEASLAAQNDVKVNQRVRLDSGGAIALAIGAVDVDIDSDATTGLGDDAKLVVDRGNIDMAAWGTADVDIAVNGTTYGGAGALSGKADIDYAGTNTATIGENAIVEATRGVFAGTGKAPTGGDVAITAGRTDAAGRPQPKLNFDATIDLYNKTVIPIPATPNPKAKVRVNSNITVAGGTDEQGVRAAGDILLATGKGDVQAKARGTGKDIYREILAKLASAISNAFGGGDVTFDYHGGSTDVKTASGVKLDGTLQTGLQRTKSITLDYKNGSCDPADVTCTQASAGSTIGYTTKSGLAVGSQAFDRIAELEGLKATYKDDVIAVAAYNSEIKFLQDKLVAGGLASRNNGVFVRSAGAAISPKAQLLAQSAAQVTAVDNTVAQLETVITGVAARDFSGTTGAVKGIFTAADIGTTQAAADAGAKIKTFKAYKAADKVVIDNAIADLAAAASAASQADTQARNNASDKAIFDAQIAKLKTERAKLATAVEANDKAAETAALAAINDVRAQIDTDLGDVKTNKAKVDTQVALAKSKADAGYRKLNDLAQAIYARHTDTTTADAKADKAALAALRKTGTPASGGTAADPGGELFDITLATAMLASADTEMKASTTAVAQQTGAANFTANFDAVKNGTIHGATLARDAKTASTVVTTQTTNKLIVDDAFARIGNISVESDNLTGSGDLNAPGDAEISVTNNTSNILEVGNLVIDTTGKGQVRFNGVFINKETDVDDLNADGGTFSGRVMNALTSSRGQVEIESNYNPESSAYFDASSAAVHKKTRRAAPDIITRTGTKIDNLEGAVAIESAAGDISINGAIDAGSVDIIAKNGDFVSSFVNGFNHVGGDPGSFSQPTSSLEAGSGITANGAISIAARFLNINSTIRSGIAAQSLVVDAQPTIRASASQLGIETEVNTAKDAYRTALIDYLAGKSGATKANVVAKAKLKSSSNSDIDIDLLDGADASKLLDAVKDYSDKKKVDFYANPLRLVEVDGKATLLNMKDYLSGSPKQRIATTTAAADAAAKAAGTETAFELVAKAGSTIGASYVTGGTDGAHIAVDPTTVKGGSIQIFGQVMNTAAAVGGKAVGRLEALDGFGTIDIDNKSGLAIVLDTLSTGDDAKGDGRGTKGRVAITDVRKVYVDGSGNVIADGTTGGTAKVLARETIYTRENGKVNTKTRSGTINADGTISYGAQSSSDGENRTATYNPTAHQRYVWTTATKNTATTTFRVKSTELFGSSALTVTKNTRLTGASTKVNSSARVADGTYVTNTRTQTGGTFAQQTNNGIVFKSAPQTKNNDDPGIAAYEKSEASYITDETQEVTKREKKCKGWTLCIASNVTIHYKLDQDYLTTTTNSLKADQPIAVEFIGRDAGTLDIESDADVVLKGTVSNVAGATQIAANGGSIIQDNLAAGIVSKSINLSAAGGIGGVARNGTIDRAANDVNVRLLGTDGSLSATADSGNVAITSRGPLRVATVTAKGERTLAADSKGMVRLKATGDITGADGNALIQANRVELNAANGKITGASGGLLAVETGFNSDPASRSFGESAAANPLLGLSAAAQGDIAIEGGKWAGNDDTGTMLIHKVESAGGNVTLKTPGQILDNNPVETIDTRTYAELKSYWDDLGLLEGSAANDTKTEKVIDSIERGRVAEYKRYWAIRKGQADGGTAFDATHEVKVKGLQLEVLREHYADKARAAGTTAQADIDKAVTAGIAAYEAEKTADYRKLNTSLAIGSAAYDENYAGTLSAAERATLIDTSQWTEAELAFAMAPGALKTVTATNPVLKAANVTGRKVVLEAGTSIGETINSNQALADGGIANAGLAIAGGTKPKDLSADQKVALAVAERSDLRLKVAKVTAPTLPVGATAAQQAEHATKLAAYNAAIAAGVNDGKSTLIDLGKDEAKLGARAQAALSAAALGLVAQSDNTLIVLSKRPVNFDAATSLDLTVGAGTIGKLDNGAAYVASRGNVVLDQITAADEARIKVLGDITSAANAKITTGNIILEAGRGAIGTETSPVTLDLKAGATTTARAQNGINLAFKTDGIVDTIFSPSANGKTGVADVKLEALAGSLFGANDDDLLNVLGTNVQLFAKQGGLGTGAAGAHRLNVGVNKGGRITAKAKDAIALYGPRTNRFLIGSAISTNGGAIALTAGGTGIVDGKVSTTGKITLAATDKQVITTAGDVTSGADDIAITATDLTMLEGAKATAKTGRVTVKTTGDSRVTGITAGAADKAAIDIEAGGEIFAGTTAGRTDLTARTAGAGVKLLAGTGIGARTKSGNAFEGEGAGAITNAANLLIIATGHLDATTKAGDAKLRALDTLTATVNAKGAVELSGDKALTVTTATSGTTMVLTAKDALTTGTLNAAGDLSLTSTAGSITATTTNSTGAVKAVAAQNLTATSVTANGDITGTAGADLKIGTATSGGKQSFTAGGRLMAGTLDAKGAVALTSTKANIMVDTVTAKGTLTAKAATTLTIGTADAKSDISLMAGAAGTAGTLTSGGNIAANVAGNLSVTQLAAANKVNLTSGGALTIDTSKSGGTQSLQSVGDTTFKTITTTGTATDPGDVAITAKPGAIKGGNIDAAGSIRLNGNGITFGTITAKKDSTLTSAGNIKGRAQIAGGTVTNKAGSATRRGDMAIDTIRAARMQLEASGKLTLANLEVEKQLTLRADELVAGVTQVPSSDRALRLTLTGPLLGSGGSEGTALDLKVDAGSVAVDHLAFRDARIDTTAKTFQIGRAQVSGEMLLTTPWQTVLADNRTPAPRMMPNVQLFAEDGLFDLNLRERLSISNAFVVRYDTSAQSLDALSGDLFRGISVQRHTDRSLVQTDDGHIEIATKRRRFGPVRAKARRDEGRDFGPRLSRAIVDLSNIVVEIDGEDYALRVDRNQPAVQLNLTGR